MFDWNDLRIFLAVARNGSALAAAQKLNLNQTTVTRRIDALEHALGICLFLRDTRGSTLTPQGSHLLLHAEAAESAALAFDGEAGRLRRDLSGEICVTAPEVIMAQFIGPLTQNFRRWWKAADDARLKITKKAGQQADAQTRTDDAAHIWHGIAGGDDFQRVCVGHEERYCRQVHKGGAIGDDAVLAQIGHRARHPASVTITLGAICAPYDIGQCNADKPIADDFAARAKCNVRFALGKVQVVFG